VSDTAHGILTLATAPSLAHPLYHLGLGREVSVGEVLDLLRRAYRDLTWDSRSDAPGLNPNIAGLPRRQPLDCTRFATEFGWAPTIGIEDGMRRYLDWVAASSV
jgi:nucleoside-diphosphate-sugar epimerase